MARKMPTKTSASPISSGCCCARPPFERERFFLRTRAGDLGRRCFERFLGAMNANFVGTASAPASYLLSVRRSFTLFLVIAVGILAALAVADALRPKGGAGPAATPPATTTRPGPPTLLDTLREEAISGFVLYSDRDCRLHSLLLPRMIDDVVRDEGGADILHCRFDVDGGQIVPGHLSNAGRLAFRDGQIASGDRVLLTHADLVRAARRHPNVFG